MFRYVAKRLVIMIPILLAVTILVFVLMAFVPGDPVSISLGGQNATQEQINMVRENLGLNRPFFIRLVEYLKNVILHLDFGNSYIYGTSVGRELMNRFPKTLVLALGCNLVTVLVGIPIGVRAAVKANTLEDRFSMFVTLIGASMPEFWLALLLVLFFSVRLNLLPSSGYATWKHFILPIMANSIAGIASIARQTRSSMLEVIRSDFVTTARSKGLSERKVIYGHALPNALIPIITICGTRFGAMLGGTMIIETIFSIPGIGSYLMNGINSRDYNVVQGSVVYIAATFSVIMLLTDLVYAFADPRIKASYTNKSGRVKNAG